MKRARLKIKTKDGRVVVLLLSKGEYDLAKRHPYIFENHTLKELKQMYPKQIVDS
jgi:hypothetical protein